MNFRHSMGAALALLSTLMFLASPANAQAPKNISMTVGVCDPAYGQRCIKPDTNGAVPITGSLTPAGTQDTNLKQVNGAAVNVGTGAAGTGTQRVTTSTDSTIGTLTGGGVASGSADSGNPVKVGCVFNSAQPTFTAGQRGDCQFDSRGSLIVTIGQVGGIATVNSLTADGNGNTAGLNVNNRAVLYNGSGWDRAFTCINSAAVSVTAGSTTQIVGLSGSTVIRVCSLALSMSAAGTAGVYTGTGSNCGTGTATLITDMTLPTGTPLTLSAPQGGSIVRSSAGGEICVKAVTGNVTGVITYAQF